MQNQSDSSSDQRIPTRNLILNSLPEKDYGRLLPDLEPVELSLGQTLYQPGEPIEYIYFPDNAMASVIANTISGQSAEVGVVGYEGLVGIEVLMGGDSPVNEVIIQLSNGGLRIKTKTILAEFNRAEALHDLILRFIHLHLIQISQTALCNRLHSVEERLSRWLLLCHDRSPTDKLQLTQEFLSIMLGSNRATVTGSALKLQNLGHIEYSRGNIKILNRKKLEKFTCNCYQTVKQQYDRLSK